MATAIIVFLAAVCAVLTAAFVILFGKYRDMSGTVDTMLDYIGKIDGDKKQLIEDKREMYAEIGRLKSDNDTLADAVRALRKRNSELVNINKTLTSREPAAMSQQKPEPRDENAAITWTIDRLAKGLTNTFRCMDFRTITTPNSQQIILQDDDCTGTDDETGIRYSVIGGERYYHAALATAYGITIGNAFRVCLDNGYVFNILHAEYKHDIRHPRADDFGDPDRNYRGQTTTSVIEFVYDWKSAPREVIDRGGLFIEPFTDGINNMTGNIVKIEFLGRRWKP